MELTWSKIAANYHKIQHPEMNGDAFQRAVGSVGQLADHIERSALSSFLFGWTSMFDLCICQTDGRPYSAPYLRISPLASGKVEFRYFDTAISTRQWHRLVAPQDVIQRLERFLDQLRWIASVRHDAT
jgi:hypothetical protein